jgi:hypothetical protein
MERKLGEIFTYNGKIYQVVKGVTCDGCCILNDHCFSIREFLGPCTYVARTDKTGIIFKEINNMEIKNNQLTIDIPEGMEIDTENSSLAEGIIKFKSKYITYSKIINSFNSMTNTNVYIHSSDTKALKAIARLMNIAKYYNGDWNPDWSDPSEYKYFIVYNSNIYKVDYNWTSIYDRIYFKNKKDAQAVIDNPNFRDILDAIYKN